MSNMLKISSSPHIHSGRSTAAIMRDVVLALLPAAMAGTIIFGLRSLAVIAACCIGSVGFEFLINLIRKKEQTIIRLLLFAFAISQKFSLIFSLTGIYVKEILENNGIDNTK